MANVFERFAIMDTGIASVFKATDGKIHSVFKNCNNFKLTVKSNAKEVKERGQVVMSISEPKTGELSFESETTSFNALSLSLGSAGLKLNSTTENYIQTENFVVTDPASMKFTLKNEPKSASDCEVYLLTRDGELQKSLAFTIGTTNKKEITITTDADVKADSKVEFHYTTSMATGTLYTFKVPSRSANNAYRLILDVLGLNKTDQSKMLMQFDFYKVMFEEGVDITFDAMNPSKFNVKLKVLSDTSIEDTDPSDGFFRVNVPKEVTP